MDMSGIYLTERSSRLVMTCFNKFPLIFDLVIHALVKETSISVGCQT